jgi:hypothetical protein
MNEVTLIIERIRGGDAGATDDLLPIVYNELRRMAGRKLDAEPGHPTIQTAITPNELVLHHHKSFRPRRPKWHRM